MPGTYWAEVKSVCVFQCSVTYKPFQLQGATQHNPAQGLPLQNANLWCWRFLPNVKSLTWIFHSFSQQGSVPHSWNVKRVVKSCNLSSPWFRLGIYCERLFNMTFPSHAFSQNYLHLPIGTWAVPLTCRALLSRFFTSCWAPGRGRSLFSQDNTQAFPIEFFYWEGN